jgi:predicted nucleotidyltransferase
MVLTIEDQTKAYKQFTECIIRIINALMKKRSCVPESADELLYVSKILQQAVLYDEYHTVYNICSPFFLRFKEEILSEKEDELLNYDFLKLIQEDAENSTKNILHILIKNIKILWATKLEEKYKNFIKMNIKACLNVCLYIEKFS